MKLYSIKNLQTQVFNPPFVARDDADANEIVRKAIITGRDVSLLVELDNLALYQVGHFDPYDATLEDELVCLVLLNEVPLPDHLKTMIDKLKEVKSNND